MFRRFAAVSAAAAVLGVPTGASAMPAAPDRAHSSISAPPELGVTNDSGAGPSTAEWALIATAPIVLLGAAGFAAASTGRRRTQAGLSQ